MKGTTRRKTTRTSGWLVAGCLLATVAAVPAEEAATVAEDRGMWEMAYGDVYYRVIGELKNASAKPLTYVKLEIDLLDAEGKVVKTLHGYNQKAEFLAGVEGLGADLASDESFEKKLERVEPIPAGGSDAFRIGIGKEEIPTKPKFKSYRVRIVETK
jgi:hypothetical protein